VAIKMTEAELQQLGFIVAPDNPSEAVPVKTDALPDDSWTFERLMTCGACAVTESGRLLTAASELARKSTIQIYRAGRALSLARHKLPLGQTWGGCLKAHHIPRTSAWEAIQVFERAGCEEAIALLTPTEAKQKFGITKPRKSANEEEQESPSTISFPKSTDDHQGWDSQGTSEDDGCLDLAGGVEDLDSDDGLAEDAEADETDSLNSIDDEAKDNEPPDHEPESVLRLLVKINAALALAATIPVVDEDRDQIETAITEAHKLLDEIEVGV
jgi:hypothetical protein